VANHGSLSRPTGRKIHDDVLVLPLLSLLSGMAGIKAILKKLDA
jgi:hypothetical protein